jgi:hypothetical protein
VTLLANLAGWERRRLRKHAELLDNLGIGDYTEMIFISCEKFVRLLYMPVATAKPITSINELRRDLFKKGQKEADKLPPTKSALTERLKRAFVWRQSSSAEISLPSPVGHGWYADSEGYLHPQLMPATVAAVLHTVSQVLFCKCKDCSRKRRSCRSKNLSCYAACSCKATSFHNPWTVSIDTSEES